MRLLIRQWCPRCAACTLSAECAWCGAEMCEACATVPRPGLPAPMCADCKAEEFDRD